MECHLNLNQVSLKVYQPLPKDSLNHNNSHHLKLNNNHKHHNNLKMTSNIIQVSNPSNQLTMADTVTNNHNSQWTKLLKCNNLINNSNINLNSQWVASIAINMRNFIHQIHINKSKSERKSQLIKLLISLF